MWDQGVIQPGSRPLDYLRLLANAPHSLVIHGNFLDEEERAFMAAQHERMSLVYCPRTHTYFQHPPYPLKDLLDRGVNVALGTDSRASNPDLDLLAEMRYIARTYDAMEPDQVLRLGTIAGAVALRRTDEIGSLTPGKLANIVALPLDDIHCGNAADALARLLANDSGPTAVWFRGRRVQPTPDGSENT
jgi:cytosine/adenosine deaminase-related metal-dependent hydrolase